MKEGQGKQQADMRLKLPVFPGEKDDVFTKMGQLFIDTFEDLVSALEILEVHSTATAWQCDIDTLMVRYLKVIKEYQELLFTQPGQKQVMETPQIAQEETSA